MSLSTRDAFRVVEQFEDALAEYTGAPFVVTTDSCTNALLLCFMLRKTNDGGDIITVPAHTYVGVVRAATSAGHHIKLTEEKWIGEHEIRPLRIWDAAKWFRRGMYRNGTLTCVSFQAAKQLPIGRGGAILCDDEDDAEWLRRARFDGRDSHLSVHRQKHFQWGIHAYMPPPDAARGLWLLSWMQGDNQPIGSWENYPNLKDKEFS